MTEYLELSPHPLALIESLRNLGYSIETAVADLIDNSIYAGAREIHIDFSWNEGDPWLAISDNGCGMSREELIAAMRFGSSSPLALRSPSDLGRFGLGLKTASLSQCRHLTVMSSRKGEVSFSEWDLDRISRGNEDGWRLGIFGVEEARHRPVLDRVLPRLENAKGNGTVVLWENIDRVYEPSGTSRPDTYFNSQIDDTRKHLELVFHRFLAPEEVGKTKVRMLMNGDELVAFNPFNPRSLATQELEQQRIVLDGATVIVQPYVLPHHSKVSAEEYERYAGEGGYLHNQGFYVYRNRRLIIKGTWFRLMKKVELNKLLRVRVDIPNSLDHLWKIDIRKAQASPPEPIREELKQVIKRIEFSGRRVYRQRGQRIASNSKTPFWNRVAVGGRVTYRINRSHPLLSQIAQDAPDESRQLLDNLITAIESSFPADLFFHDMASQPESVALPTLPEAQLSALLDIYLKSWGVTGPVSEEDTARILGVDPFAFNRELTLQLLQSRRDPNG